MDAKRFDSISKLFADRRLSRRDALVKGGVGLAAAGLATAGLTSASAQEATPSAETTGSKKTPPMLFLQSFQAGSIAAKDGVADTFTLTLEQGLGQTIYFSDRPDRIVGATSTPDFLNTLGFPADNPPNAALLLDGGEGNTEFAVLELFSPVYDVDTHTATYDVQILQQWEQSLDLVFSDQPKDLADVTPSFGAAHLFIDGILDCPNADLICFTGNHFDASSPHIGTIPNLDHDGYCIQSASTYCYPCAAPAAGGNWEDECNRRFTECNGECHYWPSCTSPFYSAATCDDGYR
jgi:hypothetical protein